MTIQTSKKQKRLPELGTLVRIAEKITHESETGGYLVQPQFIRNRQPGANGIYRGYVPGGGGDLWWIEHEDGTVGAYLYTEVFDRK